MRVTDRPLVRASKSMSPRGEGSTRRSRFRISRAESPRISAARPLMATTFSSGAMVITPLDMRARMRSLNSFSY